MKQALLFILLLLINVHLVVAQTGSASIVVNGVTRTYTYYLPVGYDINCSYPLLIVYHGSGGTGAGIKSYAGFDAIADIEKFIPVYPDAKCANNEWNTNCSACAVNDIAFTQQLSSKMNTDFNIDLTRVYAAGHSNGGFFINYACTQNSSVFAARAVVAGNLCGWWWPPLTPGIPYLHIHATCDPTVTYIDNETFTDNNGNCVRDAGEPFDDANGNGVYNPGDGINDWPVGDYFAVFPDVNCPNYTITPNFVAGADKITYNACLNDNNVIVIRSNAKSHAWNIGVPALNTAQEIWDFVSQYNNAGKSLYVPPQCGVVPPITNHHIKIDQFGYPTWAQKIAVISTPQTGYNAPDPFIPGNSYQVRRSSDNVSVFSAAPTTFNAGATHTQSGDKVSWFDFSSLTTPGTYHIFDVANNEKSYDFEINDCVYDDVLKNVLRSFYYQRCGTPKVTPFAHANWQDANSCHIGNLQDTDCRLYSNPVIATSKNLQGGWHDAGDYNKYVNFTYKPIIDLLLAYYENPSIWSDDCNIPESGNSIPDILDEVKYELDWLLKMQQPNGSVLSVVGVLNFPGSNSPPSTDNFQRYYGPASTSTAHTAATLFALAASIYRIPGNPTLNVYADNLQTAAQNAWNWAVANPAVTFQNQPVGLAAGEQELQEWDNATNSWVVSWSQIEARKISAACFLYAATGNTTYKTYFENNYSNIHLIQWSFAYTFESTIQDVLLFYTKLPNITAAVKNNILNAYSQSMQNYTDNLPAFTAKTDAYRAFMTDNNYTWGNNEFKAHNGSMFFNMLTYNLNSANATNYRNAGMGYLHYLNGVNPVNYCYLSNMSSVGAENSVPTLYHAWFADATVWDEVGVGGNIGPAPGFLPGGANPSYAPNAICACTIEPPQNQPVQKSYYAWNDSNWQVESWEISEIGIYQQAAYLKLISKIWSLNSGATCSGCTIPAVVTGANNICPNTTQTYTANTVVAATYNWIVTGGTIQSGQGTPTVTVLWGNGTNGNLQLSITKN